MSHCVDWSSVAQDRDKWRPFVNMVLNPLESYKARTLTSWETAGFSKGLYSLDLFICLCLCVFIYWFSCIYKSLSVQIIELLKPARAACAARKS